MSARRQQGNATSLPQQALEVLKGARGRLADSRVLLGFDGFVDTILHVVDQRASGTEYRRLSRMGEFSRRINTAAGLSANFEFVTRMVKLGGNGPIMGNALAASGARVSYIGSLGLPTVHPVFAPFARVAEVHSIAGPGFTDAIEFDDGKLMCGKLDNLAEVNWPNLVRHLPEAKLQRLFSDSSLIAMVNWTMLPGLTGIMQKVLTRIAPGLRGPRRWMFLDLCDPAKRTPADIARILKLTGRFERYFNVILGLNLPESRQIGEVLGIRLRGDSFQAVKVHAAQLREVLGIHTVAIHPPGFAAAADAEEAVHVVGPYTPTPRITTGAGDHFNAGFGMGSMLGGHLAASLQIGVAASGYYVRNAKSPPLAALRSYLRTL